MYSRTSRNSYGDVVEPMKRVLVGVLDGIFITVSGTVFGMLFGGMVARAHIAAGNESTGAGAQGVEALGGVLGGILGFIIGPFIIAVVFMIIEGFFGTTPAGKLLGTKVYRDDGMEAGKGVLFIRSAMKYAPAWLFLLGLLLDVDFFVDLSDYAFTILFAGMFVALGESRQTLYDLASKTNVFHT